MGGYLQSVKDPRYYKTEFCLSEADPWLNHDEPGVFMYSNE